MRHTPCGFAQVWLVWTACARPLCLVMEGYPEDHTDRKGTGAGWLQNVAFAFRTYRSDRALWRQARMWYRAQPGSRAVVRLGLDWVYPHCSASTHRPRWRQAAALVARKAS